MPDTNQPPANPADPHSTEPLPPRPRRKRRWLKVLAVLLLLLVALVILLPTLLSLRPVRSFIVNQMQGVVVPNGSLVVGDWSFGWFSPIQIQGVKVFDSEKQLVLEADQVKTDLTIIKALRQQFELGETTIDANATMVKVYPDGRTNLHHVFGLNDLQPPPAQPEPKKADDGEIEVPEITGNITLKLRGAVQLVDAAGGHVAMMQLRQGSGGTIRIDDIDQGIAPNLMFVYDVDGAAPSTLTVAGTVDAFEDQELDLAQLTAALDVVLSQINLRAVQPFLAMAGVVGTEVRDGTLDGKLAINLQPGLPGAAKGDLLVRSLHVVTPQLKDEYKAAEIRIPVNIARSVDGEHVRLTIDTQVQAPEATLAVTGDVPQVALDNLAASRMPGADGTLNVTLTADPRRIAVAFPRTLNLQPGVSIDGGQIKTVIDLGLKPDRIELRSDSNISVAAQNAGKPIEVPPIGLTAAGSVTDLSDPVRGIQDIGIVLTSDFLNFKAGGKSVANIKGEGTFDGGRLQRVAEQFVDLGETELAGTGKLTLHSWQTNNTTLRTELGLEGKQIRLVLATREPIDVDAIEGSVSAQMPFDANNPGAVNRIEWATASLAVHPPRAEAPLVDGAITLKGIDLQKQDVAFFAIERGAITNLPEAQRLLQPLVNIAQDFGLDFQNGAAYLAAKGSIQNGTAITLENLSASITSIDVAKGGQRLYSDRKIGFVTAGTVKMGEERTTVDLSQLRLESAIATLSKGKDPISVQVVKGVPSGNGTITIQRIDAPAVNAIARAMAGKDAQLPVVSSGLFSGNATLAGGQQDATIVMAGELSDLTIDATPIKNERIALSLDAALKSDAQGAPQSATATANVNSSFATLDMSKVAVKLAEGTPMLQRVQSAVVALSAPDTARLQTIATALVPGLKLPVNMSGSIQLNATLEPTTAVISFKGDNVALANDSGQTFRFGADPVSLDARLTDIKGTSTLEAVTVSQFDAKLGVATAQATRPIVVSGLAGDAPQYDGELELAAAIDKAAPLLQVLTAADEPLAFAGNLKVRQTISTQGGRTSLKGGGVIDNFQVLDPATGRAQLTEKQARIENDVIVDLQKSIATINALNLDMASSQAAKLRVTGTVSDWATQALLKDINLDFDSKGENLWPILYALMSPEQQAQFSDAKLWGPLGASLVVNGSYDAAKPMHEAITGLAASGLLRMEYGETSGLYISDFEQPITLVHRKGQLITGDMSRKGADRFGKPFTINNGKGDINSIVLGLADPDLRLSIGRGQKLLQQIQLNPLLAAQLGSLASVMFKDAKQASGLVDLTVVECKDVKLAELMNKKARATFTYGVKDLRLDGPVPSALAAALRWGSQGIVGNIRDGKLELRDGLAHQDMTLMLLKEIERRNAQGVKETEETQEWIRFVGGIDLGSNTFRDYKMVISSGLLLKDWRKAYPNGMEVELRGRVDDIGSIMTQAIAQLAVKGAVGSEIQEGIEKGLEGLLKKRK